MIQISGIIGGGGGAPEPITGKISYTGDMVYSLKFMDGALYHLLTLESSGALAVTGTIVGDVWMCGGGASGGIYTGGSGGFTANYFNVPIVSAAITIGAGGYPNAYNTTSDRGGFAGGATSYPGVGSANGAAKGTAFAPYQAGNGGCGGGGYGNDSAASPGGVGQGTTTRPFQSQDMPPQCGGGGGRTNTSGDNWSETVRCYLGGNGGSDGGSGTGGSPSVYANRNVANNCSNGGAGGGGGGSMRGYLPQYSNDGGSFGRDSASVRTSFFLQPNAGRGGGFGYGGGGGGANYENNTTGSGVGTPGAVMIRIPV